MTSIGTGYDLANSIFSPDGRNFQVEYAIKAVENGGTAVGIRCKDGVVLAVEKLITSKLLKPSANKRIATVDWHMGIVSSGLIPDGRRIAIAAREVATYHRQAYFKPAAVSFVADNVAHYVQQHTMAASVRPFGVSAILIGFDDDTESGIDGEVGLGPSVGAGGKMPGKMKEGGPGLYMIEPSGLYWGYYGAATGKGRQAAKAELEKLNLHDDPPSLEDGVREAARIIYIAHEDSKDKEFELEMSWVSKSSGPTKGKHEEVPKDLLEDAERLAKKALEPDDEEEGGGEEGEGQEGDRMEE